MWNIELNVAGYRFTREVPELRGPSIRSLRSVRFNTCNVRWRVPRLRQPHTV